MKRLSLTLSVVAGCGALIAQATTLDSNFQETTFAAVGSQTTGLAWAPDGSKRLFVSQKDGDIQIVKDGAVLGTPFATVSPIFLNSECGLVGICFDPNFAVNGYVYVFVTVSSTEQQVIRYTAVGDVGMNKTTLIPDLPTQGQNHDGGAIEVGPDGKLYWAIGDNGNGTGVDTDLTSLASKVGRANLDGSVPTDNPFVDGPGGNNDYIWARGFRNPFTFTFQPDTGELWVNCVGTLYEQMFLVQAGDHAGWDDYENNQPAGYITPKIKYRTNGTDTRDIPASGAVRSGNVVTFTTTSTHGFRQGEQITIAGVTDGSFNGTVYVATVPSATSFTAAQAGADSASGDGTATTSNQGGAVTGGCFYDSTAVPPAYRGNFIYGDLNSGRLMRARLSSSNTVLSVDYFGTGSTSQIDITVGPDGALYYVEHGGEIHRLAYTNYANQEIIVTPTVMRMFEGGAAAFMVRLAQQPAGDVEVNIARTSGDAGINVSTGATLSFNAANWSVPQPALLQAAADANSTDSMATFTVSATGLSSQTVNVHALDVPSLNTPPVGGSHSVTTRTNLPLVISINKLLAGASDADGDGLSITGVASALPAGATVSLGSTTITYTPPATAGAGSFQFTLNDGRGGTATVTVSVTITDSASGGVSPNVVYGPIIDTVPDPDQFVVRFAGHPGAEYTIEFSANSTGPWIKKVNKTAPTDNSAGFGIGVFEFREPIGTSGFYRTVYPSY